jgi:hypothetical protein
MASTGETVALNRPALQFGQRQQRGNTGFIVEGLLQFAAIRTFPRKDGAGDVYKAECDVLSGGSVLRVEVFGHSEAELAADVEELVNKDVRVRVSNFRPNRYGRPLWVGGESVVIIGDFEFAS